MSGENLSMLDEIKDFLEHLKYDHGYSDKTLDSYGRDIEQFYRINFKHGVDITDVDAGTIRNYLSELMMNGVSKRSCQRKVASLRHYYSYLLKKGVVKENPFLYLDSIKQDINLPNVLFVYQDRQYGGLKCFEITVSYPDMLMVKERFERVVDLAKKNLVPEPLPRGDKWCTRSMCPYYNVCGEYGR